jgi:hypothetical protein
MLHPSPDTDARRMSVDLQESLSMHFDESSFDLLKDKISLPENDSLGELDMYMGTLTIKAPERTGRGREDLVMSSAGSESDSDSEPDCAGLLEERLRDMTIEEDAVQQSKDENGRDGVSTPPPVQPSGCNLPSQYLFFPHARHTVPPDFSLPLQPRRHPCASSCARGTKRTFPPLRLLPTHLRRSCPSEVRVPRYLDFPCSPRPRQPPCGSPKRHLYLHQSRHLSQDASQREAQRLPRMLLLPVLRPYHHSDHHRGATSNSVGCSGRLHPPRSSHLQSRRPYARSLSFSLSGTGRRRRRRRHRLRRPRQRQRRGPVCAHRAYVHLHRARAVLGSRCRAAFLLAPVTARQGRRWRPAAASVLVGWVWAARPVLPGRDL